MPVYRYRQHLIALTSEKLGSHDQYARDKKEILMIHPNGECSNCLEQTFAIKHQEYTIGVEKLVKETEHTYHGSDSITVIKKISYEPTYYLLRADTIINNCNRNIPETYQYVYDNLSRLKMTGGIYNWMEYEYDKNGNIQYINRNVDYEYYAYGVDNVHFSYSGNQLKNFSDEGETDATISRYDIKDYTNQTTEYTYNKNGAMTKDLNAGISKIQYNLLNLPEKIEIKSPIAEAIEKCFYMATGEKLSVVHEWNPYYSTNPVIGSEVGFSNVSSWDRVEYVKNIEYNYYNELLKIKYDNGYYSGPDDKNYFYIKDHLGTVRVVIDKDSDVAQYTDYDPFGMIMPNSTNQSVQAYKYNGKEFMEQSGLNIYDYGARWYDPARIQFWTMDPLAEKYPLDKSVCVLWE